MRICPIATSPHLSCIGSAIGVILCSQAFAQLTVNSDNFESGLSDDTAFIGSIANWTAIDTGNGGRIGTFNPDSTGQWYNLTDLDDSSLTGGEVGTMDGPVAAFVFSGGAGDGFSRDLGLIEGDQQYTATFSISGARSNGDAFHGYTLELYSGAMVLSTVSSNLSPGTFQDVSVVWESTSLPGGVSVGDSLSLRLLSNGQGDYLDVDNFRVAGISIPEPTGLTLLVLGLSSILLNKRRRN